MGFPANIVEIFRSWKVDRNIILDGNAPYIFLSTSSRIKNGELDKNAVDVKSLGIIADWICKSPHCEGFIDLMVLGQRIPASAEAIKISHYKKAAAGLAEQGKPYDVLLLRVQAQSFSDQNCWPSLEISSAAEAAFRQAMINSFVRDDGYLENFINYIQTSGNEVDIKKFTKGIWEQLPDIIRAGLEHVRETGDAELLEHRRKLVKFLSSEEFWLDVELTGRPTSRKIASVPKGSVRKQGPKPA